MLRYQNLRGGVSRRLRLNWRYVDNSGWIPLADLGGHLTSEVQLDLSEAVDASLLADLESPPEDIVLLLFNSESQFDLTVWVAGRQAIGVSRSSTRQLRESRARAAVDRAFAWMEEAGERAAAIMLTEIEAGDLSTEQPERIMARASQLIEEMDPPSDRDDDGRNGWSHEEWRRALMNERIEAMKSSLSQERNSE